MSGEILHQLDPTITQPFQANGDGHALPIQDATAALATPAPHSHEINPFLPKVALSLALPRGAEPLYPSKHRQIVEEGNMEYARVIASQVKIGEARANTLRYSIIRDDTEYGNEFFACMDHPALAHHGHHHSRHVEALQKQAIKSYVLEKGRGLFTIPYAQEDIDSAMLFPYLHDIDQQSAAFRNITEEEGKLKEKRGHGIGAAVMTMAMTSRYSEVNNIDINQAWRITKTASIMMMRHDIPERFDRTFNPQNTRAELFKDKPIEDLVAAFENDTLDLFSLSPRQAIDILKSIKAKHGFMSDGKSIYGLSPAFEKEFAAELEILSRSEDPLFKDLLPSRRKRLLVLTEAAYWADMGDMICPPDDQITRTLQTQYSRNRLWCPKFDDEHEVESYEERAASVERAADALFTEILTTEDSNLPSDTQRILWEAVHAGSISKDTNISNLTWIREFTEEHVFLGIMALRKLGLGIMKGDTTPICRIYEKRLKRLDEKKRKNEQNFGIHYNGAYTAKVQHIMEERDAVIDSVNRKAVAYSEFDRQVFNALVEKTLRHLIDKYNVPMEQYLAYEETSAEEGDAFTKPFDSDSLPAKPLTVMKNF